MSAASPLPSQNYTPLTSPATRNPDLNPNPHPYAIKTTSTALLSRSNSSGFNTNAARNHYVPLSPSPTRSKHNMNGGKHRTAKSEYIPDTSPTSKAPRPLPTPPAFPTSSSDGASTDKPGLRRSKRADTLPSTSQPFNIFPVSVSIDDLPSNPKLWTPNELSTYLMMALRITSQDKSQDSNEVVLPARVAKDVAGFIREMRITGRTFLRLNEEDLNIMGVNQKWREALLLASRNLRQNVLKGRIWGPDLDADLEDIASPSSSRPGSTSSSPSRPLPTPPLFSNPQYSSSQSSLELPAPEPVGTPPRLRRRGRVRGLVESFERSGSFSSDTGSIDDGRPDADLVEEWRNETHRSEQDDDALSVSSEPASPMFDADTTFTAESTVVDAENEISALVKDSVEVEEPSIEELLAASDPFTAPKHASWGARAWEDMDLAPGVTVKRASDEALNGLDTIVADSSRSGSGKSSSYGTRGRGRDERRIVTAIFSPPTSVVREDLGPETEKSLPQAPSQPATIGEPHSGLQGIQASGATQSPIERALLSELAETRALIEAFRSRLETVEQKVAAFEGRELKIVSEQVSSTSRCRYTARDPAGSGKADLEPTLSSALLSQASCLLPPFVSSLSSSSSSLTQRSRNSVRNAPPTDEDPEREREPASVSDIPSYVFLVGIGVCAVVLQVVLKRVGGRKG